MCKCRAMIPQAVFSLRKRDRERLYDDRGDALLYMISWKGLLGLDCFERKHERI